MTAHLAPPPVLTPEKLRQASDLLVRYWEEGRRMEALPPPLRPGSRAEAYRLQALLERRSAAPLFGWKIAATSAAGQAHIGVGGPLAGRLLAERVVENGGTLSLEGCAMRVAEAEFAFRLARDLPPRAAPYEPAEAMDAVASLHPAIEIPDSRFTDPTAVGEVQAAALRRREQAEEEVWQAAWAQGRRRRKHWAVATRGRCLCERRGGRTGANCGAQSGFGGRHGMAPRHLLLVEP